MLAPIATLAFLATLLLLARIVADLFADSGSRIAAALRGEPRGRPVPIVQVRMPVRASYRRSQPIRARPQLRAAA